MHVYEAYIWLTIEKVLIFASASKNDTLQTLPGQKTVCGHNRLIHTLHEVHIKAVLFNIALISFHWYYVDEYIEVFQLNLDLVCSEFSVVKKDTLLWLYTTFTKRKVFA